MTLAYLINGSPTTNHSEVEVYVENNPVYDYKGNNQTIYLLSEPFEDSDQLEPVTLQELIDYSSELDFPLENINFICEYELQELTSSSWLGTKLILHF